MESCCLAYPALLLPIFLGGNTSPISSCALGGAAPPKFQEWASKLCLVDWDASYPWPLLLVQKRAHDPSESDES